MKKVRESQLVWRRDMVPLINTPSSDGLNSQAEKRLLPCPPAPVFLGGDKGQNNTHKGQEVDKWHDCCGSSFCRLRRPNQAAADEMRPPSGLRGSFSYPETNLLPGAFPHTFSGIVRFLSSHSLSRQLKKCFHFSARLCVVPLSSSSLRQRTANTSGRGTLTAAAHLSVDEVETNVIKSNFVILD